MWRPSFRAAVRGVLLGWMLLAFGASVAAQSDLERSAARATADRAHTAYVEGRYAEALELFGRAESVVPAPTLALFVARSHERLGHLVQAREEYLRILRQRLAEGAPEAFVQAQRTAASELAVLEPRLAHVTLQVTGVLADRARVVLDGTLVPTPLVGVPFPVDPGTHVLRASVGQAAAGEARFDVGEGETRSAIVQLLAPAPAPSPREATPSEPSVPPTEGGAASARRIGAYVSAGVGAIGVAAGTLFLLQRGREDSRASRRFDACNPGCSSEQSAAVRALDREAAGSGTLAIVGYGGGAAGLGLGLWLFWPQLGFDETARGVRPYWGGDRLGVFGRF